MTAVDPLVAELRDLRLKAGLTQGAVAATDLPCADYRQPLTDFERRAGVLPPPGNGATEGGTDACPWCDCGFWAEPHPCERPKIPGVARTLDDCPCGHSWGRHIFGQLPDSELCCVADCDKTRCPGAAVSLISTPGKPAVEGYSNLHDAPPTLNPDAIRDAYGLGPDPSVALIAFNDALAEDPDFAAAWERALERDPVSRTLDVAERTVEKARISTRPLNADSGYTCDWGYCMEVAAGERFDARSAQWLPACILHLDTALPAPAPVERGPAHDPPPMARAILREES